MKLFYKLNLFFSLIFVVLSFTACPQDTPYPPSEVTDLQARIGGGKVILNWTNPNDANFAKACVSTGEADYYVAGLPGAQMSKEITGLTNGNEYTFKVRSIGSNGLYSAGVSIKATPKIVLINDVEELCIKPNNKSLTLSWKNPQNTDVTTFSKSEITYAKESSPSSIIGTVTVYGAEKGAGTYVEKTISGLENGTSYVITIKAYDTFDSASNGIVIKSTPKELGFENVTNMKASTSSEPKKVELSWTNPADRENAKFEKAVLTYADSQSPETPIGSPVTFSASEHPASSKVQTIIENLDYRKDYIFTVIAYDEFDNASSGISVKGSCYDNVPPDEVKNLDVKWDGTYYTFSYDTPSQKNFRSVLIKFVSSDHGNPIIQLRDNPNSSVVNRVYFPRVENEVKFLVKTEDNHGNVSNGIIYTRKIFTSNHGSSITGLFKDTEIPGCIVTNSYMNEVIIVPKGVESKFHVYQKTSWVDYCDESMPDNYKGVFVDRYVTLSSFMMSQTEITEKVYANVMGAGNVSEKPKTNVSWYEAIAFCNELTKQSASEEMDFSDCVYYSDSSFTAIYTKDDALHHKKPYLNPSKKGYRLPTEAEWEYAARGGNPYTDEWRKAFAGNVASKKITQLVKSDSKLDEVGWNGNNSSNTVHVVGQKAANALNLHDMCGNAWEWCWDIYDADPKKNDEEYLELNYVKNPLGALNGTARVFRGGMYYGSPYYCTNSFRESFEPGYKSTASGFRVCRWF